MIRRELRNLCVIAAIVLATAATFGRAADAADADAVEKDKPVKLATTRPVSAIRHAIVISCDGLRPDVLLRADAPNIRKLLARGSFSFWARTVPVAITLPSHTSMLTGVYPERHGINWNDDQPNLGYPKVPTLFEAAKKAGFTTAIATGKSKFTTLIRPGSVDWISVPLAKDLVDKDLVPYKGGATTNDGEVAKQACEILADHQPGVMFIHFPGADKAGHGIGWGTKAQLDVIKEIDKGIGNVVRQLDESDLTSSTVVIISADHGGSGKGHGGIALGSPIDDPRSRHIPWICAGPGIRENYDLTNDASLTINTVDTFATVCYLMGIKPGDVDGKPVRQVVASRGELLHSTGSAEGTDAVKGGDAAKSADTVKSNDTAKNADIIKSTENSQSTDTVKSTDTVESADTVKSVDTVKSAEPVKSTDAVNSTDTVKSTDTTSGSK